MALPADFTSGSALHEEAHASRASPSPPARRPLAGGPATSWRDTLKELLNSCSSRGGSDGDVLDSWRQQRERRRAVLASISPDSPVKDRLPAGKPDSAALGPKPKVAAGPRARMDSDDANAAAAPAGSLKDAGAASDDGGAAVADPGSSRQHAAARSGSAATMESKALSGGAGGSPAGGAAESKFRQLLNSLKSQLAMPSDQPLRSPLLREAVSAPGSRSLPATSAQPAARPKSGQQVQQSPPSTHANSPKAETGADVVPQGANEPVPSDDGAANAGEQGAHDSLSSEHVASSSGPIDQPTDRTAAASACQAAVPALPVTAPDQQATASTAAGLEAADSPAAPAAAGRPLGSTSQHGADDTAMQRPPQLDVNVPADIGCQRSPPPPQSEVARAMLADPVSPQPTLPYRSLPPPSSTKGEKPP